VATTTKSYRRLIVKLTHSPQGVRTQEVSEYFLGHRTLSESDYGSFPLQAEQPLTVGSDTPHGLSAQPGSGSGPSVSDGLRGSNRP